MVLECSAHCLPRATALLSCSPRRTGCSSSGELVVGMRWLRAGHSSRRTADETSGTRYSECQLMDALCSLLHLHAFCRLLSPQVKEGDHVIYCKHPAAHPVSPSSLPISSLHFAVCRSRRATASSTSSTPATRWRPLAARSSTCCTPPTSWPSSEAAAEVARAAAGAARAAAAAAAAQLFLPPQP